MVMVIISKISFYFKWKFVVELTVCVEFNRSRKKREYDKWLGCLGTDPLGTPFRTKSVPKRDDKEERRNCVVHVHES